MWQSPSEQVMDKSKECGTRQDGRPGVGRQTLRGAEHGCTGVGGHGYKWRWIRGCTPEALVGHTSRYSLCGSVSKASPKGFSTGQCQGWVYIWEQSHWQFRCVNSKMTLWSSPVCLISTVIKTSRSQVEMNTDIWSKCINTTASNSNQLPFLLNPTLWGDTF